MLPVLAKSAEAADPAIAAVDEWIGAEIVYREIWRANDHVGGKSTPEEKAASAAEWHARTKACTTVATTAAGLAAQALLAVCIMGDLEPDDNVADPAIFETGDWKLTDDLDGKLLVNLMAGAQALADREALA